MTKNNGYFKIKSVKIFSADIFIHWSFILGMLVLGFIFSPDPAYTLLVSGSIFALFFIHESGHAFAAKKLGYPPSYILFQDIRGFCVYEYLPNSELDKDKSIIAWGGVLAQLALAIPIVTISNFYPQNTPSFLSPVINIFGYFSLLIIVFNLLPVKGLDGSEAWKLIGFWLNSVKKTSNKKKRENSKLTRIK
jgi:Zn-dependent protease